MNDIHREALETAVRSILKAKLHQEKTDREGPLPRQIDPEVIRFHIRNGFEQVKQERGIK